LKDGQLSMAHAKGAAALCIRARARLERGRDRERRGSRAPRAPSDGPRECGRAAIGMRKTAPTPSCLFLAALDSLGGGYDRPGKRGHHERPRGDGSRRREQRAVSTRSGLGGSWGPYMLAGVSLHFRCGAFRSFRQHRHPGCQVRQSFFPLPPSISISVSHFLPVFCSNQHPFPLFQSYHSYKAPTTGACHGELRELLNINQILPLFSARHQH